MPTCPVEIIVFDALDVVTKVFFDYSYSNMTIVEIILLIERSDNEYKEICDRTTFIDTNHNNYEIFVELKRAFCSFSFVLQICYTLENCKRLFFRNLM